MANTEDMRFVRTERAIRNAFMDLVASTPAASVTASELCRHAGISRNAFYLHHANVSALYNTLVSELVEDVRVEGIASAKRMSATGDVDHSLACAIVDAFAKHEKLLRALLPADDGTLAKQLAEGLESAYVEAALLVGQRGGPFGHRLNCAFAAWAHVGMMVRWIAETDRPITDAQEAFAALQNGLSESATRYLMT